MMAIAVTTEIAFRESARLLEKLHVLIANDKDDSDEAEALRAEMDPLWHAMTEEERDRIRGLSEDFYILAEGGAKQTPMAADEKARWTEEAASVLTRMLAGQDVDAALKFLRKPAPADQPRYIIPFMQARCWEQLDEEELALRFLKEAEHLDPHQAVCVLILLQKLGRNEDAAQYAERIIDNKQSTSEELYQAAAVLLSQAQRMPALEARPIFERIVSVLERALRVFLTTPKEQREIQVADRFIITMLGLVHERLGNVKTALRLYNDGLARYPNNAGLLTFRGLAQIDADLSAALSDCRRAVQAGTFSMWPYYFLARDALGKQNYLETWQSSLQAIELRERLVQLTDEERPNRELAQLYEWVGIAMSELGQPIDRVLDNFGKAESLDPQNQRIKYNRAVAERPKTASSEAPEDGWKIDASAISQQVIRREFPQDQQSPDLFVERSDASLIALGAGHI
jgi:tetratricopeptide (TPR) repeat protein